MIIEELISLVRTTYNKGAGSDDSRLSPRFVYSKLLAARNRYVAQQAKKNQKVSQWTYQTLPCVELIKAPMHECPCIPAVGCTIYKTKNPLPKALTDLNRHIIQSVTSLDGSLSFGETTWSEKKYKSGQRYTSGKADFYIMNNYMYITQRTGPAIVTITGIWEDPLAVYAFPSKCDDCEGTNCYDCESPLKKEFPIDGDMIDQFIEMVTVDIFNKFGVAIEDRTNDATDSPEQQSK